MQRALQLEQHHLSVIDGVDNLARSLHALAFHSKGLSHRQRAMPLNQALLPPDRVNTARTCCTDRMLLAMGMQAALPLLCQAHQVCAARAVCISVLKAGSKTDSVNFLQCIRLCTCCLCEVYTCNTTFTPRHCASEHGCCRRAGRCSRRKQACNCSHGMQHSQLDTANV